MFRLGLLVFVCAALGCSAKPSLDGTWAGDTGKDGFAIEMTLAGTKVDIDFASKKTTAKLRAEGTFTVDGETITTSISKASIDEASLTGYMKDLMNEKGLKEATENETKGLLSKQLSGAYKLEGSTLKILGNPETITFNRK